MRLLAKTGAILVAAGLCAVPANAQDGGALFNTYCAICHTDGNSRAPGRDALSRLAPGQILQVLEKGSMKAQAAERSRAQRRALAEYISGKPLPAATPIIPASAFCAASGAEFHNSLTGPVWNGWGAGITNTRFQPADSAGMNARDVPKLKLKWAFGLPGATSGGTQPVVANGRIYVGDAEGDVFALDAKSGCVFWDIEVEAGIRSAITLGERTGGLTAWFGDQAANMYAVDAATGNLLWKVHVDDHPQAAITAAPALYAGRLYVPVSSREEAKVADPRYPCCVFRGSVLALDAATGQQIWKTYTIDGKHITGQKNSAGTAIVGPSGAPVWNTPTIDAERKTLYIGTGNNYSPPATALSDSILAIDLGSGKIKWHRQQTANDIWNGTCRRADREAAACPDAESPDVDFSVSPALIKSVDGRSLLIAGNKSGMIWALDPDQQGTIVWQQQVGQGSSGGGVLWGLAADGGRVYVPNGFFDAKSPDASGGMAALDISTGRPLWTTLNPPCGDRKSCKPSHAAAVTAIPGAVFSGTMDGQLYAYSAETGKIFWRFNSAQNYVTVNGVTANGGSMSNGGATIVDGMLYVQSGYSHHGGIIPGNVLLAFSAN
ncbi:MAG TPA: PQQ-binding-like beta-propeller repeat protein [Micropepsaceae bacterium]|nr:PQQ-binding-like beta-propeller repeat protein [Micropepsaceae bacterium]